MSDKGGGDEKRGGDEKGGDKGGDKGKQKLGARHRSRRYTVPRYYSYDFDLPDISEEHEPPALDDQDTFPPLQPQPQPRFPPTRPFPTSHPSTYRAFDTDPNCPPQPPRPFNDKLIKEMKEKAEGIADRMTPLNTARDTSSSGHHRLIPSRDSNMRRLTPSRDSHVDGASSLSPRRSTSSRDSHMDGTSSSSSRRSTLLRDSYLDGDLSSLSPRRSTPSRDSYLDGASSSPRRSTSSRDFHGDGASSLSPRRSSSSRDLYSDRASSSNTRRSTSLRDSYLDEPLSLSPRRSTPSRDSYLDRATSNPRRSTQLTPLRDSHVGVAAMIAAEDAARESAARVLAEGMATINLVGDRLMNQAGSVWNDDFAVPELAEDAAIYYENLAQAFTQTRLSFFGAQNPPPRQENANLVQEERRLDFRSDVDQVPRPRIFPPRPIQRPHPQPHPRQLLQERNLNDDNFYDYIPNLNHYPFGSRGVNPLCPENPGGRLNNSNFGPRLGGRRWSGGDDSPNINIGEWVARQRAGLDSLGWDEDDDDDKSCENNNCPQEQPYPRPGPPPGFE